MSINSMQEGSETNTPPLLQIKNLNTHFFTNAGVVRAVDGINLNVQKQEIFALVGESGCGKSITARSILRLIPKSGKIVSGSISLDGVNLLELEEKQMRKLRGSVISMVFQEPMSSLNPVYRIGNQIEEILLAHHKEMTKSARKDSVIEILELVGIPSPEQRIHNYPFELSGGMRQRAMIAMALVSGNPKLLIADEPTTALDVTIQAQILELMQDLVKNLGMSVILITHDLGVVAETADRVAVMYAGSIVESALVSELFNKPLHPYTRGLIRSLPYGGKTGRKQPLYSIPGNVPNLLDLKPGCKFYDRCQYANEICLGNEPPLQEVETDHLVRCIRINDIKD
jgi:oligopeptide/dipeptide ABC transporter ATP-binding protein|tara:strand:+ start:179 stop:1204 length:1026 start_codon:yes stop_codon:yes gene_type:complete